MKKIIAVLLTLSMTLIFGITAFAAQPVANYKLSDYKDFITYNSPLTNTYKRLTSDKELNIVYFGGSVTEGYGVSIETESWRALTTEWFKEEFPSATINAYSAAIGGTDTHLGIMRLKTDVIAKNPDLVFIEFAINDNYCGLSKDDSARYLETIIREIRESNPYCDVAVVLITDKFKAPVFQFPELYINAAAHAEVANAYNVAVLDIGNALYVPLLSKSENLNDWDTYFVDSVHPSPRGHIEYFNCIKEYLTNSLFNTDFTDCQKTAHPTPEVYSEYLFDGDRTTHEGEDLKNMVTDAQGFYFDSGETATGIHTHDGCWKANDITGASLTIKFTGTELTLWTNLKNGSSISYTIDGKSGTYDFPNLGYTPVVSGLESGEHTLVIKPTAMSQDKSVFKISAICTRDETKQTGKPHTHAPASDSWSKNDTEHYQVCVCGEKINSEEHTFGEWVVVKEATESANGTRKHECEVCGKTEVEKFSLNGDVISPSSVPADDVDGDVSSFPVIPVAIGGGVLVVIAIVVIILLSKKKK